jgi:predicted Zn finger-like uncharacterized protein
MSAANEQRELTCKNCSKTFLVFLKQMAERNQKIVCPHCGQQHAYGDHALSNTIQSSQVPER